MAAALYPNSASGDGALLLVEEAKEEGEVQTLVRVEATHSTNTSSDTPHLILKGEYMTPCPLRLEVEFELGANAMQRLLDLCNVVGQQVHNS